MIIGEIQDVLSAFINENPEAWAPIISAWSLELLGIRLFAYTFIL